MSVSEENKVLARTALKAYKEKPNVFKYWGDNNKSSVDICSCEDKNFDGILTYSTLGLSEYSIGYEKNRLPLRVELVGASDFDCFSIF